jgi:molybdate transport system ATP-binding protein
MISARLQRTFPGGPESAPFTLDVDFVVKPGVTALFGPSGAGKSLTLEMIAGFVTPTSGRILLNDRLLFDAGSRVSLKPEERHCGYVFQNYALFPHLTVRENLEFAAHRLHKRDRHRRIHEVLERFRLTDVAGRKPSQISGGQKQRCSLARALASMPEILLLDEPSRGLDAPLREDLYEAIAELHKESEIPILLVSHDVDECLRLANHMLVYRDGRIVQTGSPQDVVEEPANLDVARLLNLYNIVPVEIRNLDPSRNSSTLRIGGMEGSQEIAGEYYPGHFNGDQAHLLVTPRELKAFPCPPKRGANQIAAALLHQSTGVDSVMLHLEYGLRVDVPKPDFHPSERHWAIEFPKQNLRVL